MLFTQNFGNVQSASNLSSAVVNQFIVNCASVDDLSLAAINNGNPYTHSNKENAEIDLNDELQNMQDALCFNMFRKRCKKGRKYKEWRRDEILQSDGDSMKFLERQLQRMRKKEENQVSRKGNYKK